MKSVCQTPLPATASGLRAQRVYPIVVHILLVGIFIVGWAEMSIVGILPNIASSFGIHPTELSVVISLYSVAFAIVGPVVLIGVRWMSPRFMLTLLMGVIAASSLASALADDAVTMSILRMVLAAASAAFAGTTMSVAVKLVSAEQSGGVLGYIAAGFGGALVCGVPLSIMIADVGGWELAFQLIGAGGILCALAIWTVWPGVSQVGTPPKSMQFSAIRALKADHFIGQAGILLWMLAYAIPFSFLPSILRGSLGYTASELTIAMILFGCCCMAGAQVGGFVSDRLGELRTITLAFVAHAAILAAAPFLVTSFPGVLVTMMIWGGVSWMSTPPLQALIAKTSKDISDLMLTVSNSVLHISIALGAFVGAVLMAASLVTFFYVPVVILSVAIFVMWRHRTKLVPFDGAAIVESEFKEE
ncbi:MAG: MFS transporter [Paracoccaceae bacterium]|nr:MFS transporter [Paracoccaceae bacterium]